MLARMEGNLGEHHSGELHRASAEAKAERIVAEELKRLGWAQADLAARRKNEPMKLELAARLRRETTLPQFTPSKIVELVVTRKPRFTDPLIASTAVAKVPSRHTAAS
jgi:regulator of protease activity HflC (stomatin/prohibitin superfamily)